MSLDKLLKDFTIPDRVEFLRGDDYGSYGKFVIYPFEKGFGVTIGNTLRRVLLSSIEGYAISAMRIQSNQGGGTKVVSSEFDLIPGVVEDTLEVIANIKNIHLKLDKGINSTVISFSVNGRETNVLKAANFEREGVEVLNRDLVIATLSSDASLDFEFQVNYGRGYVSSEQNAKYLEEVNTIALDSIFSPIEKVSYSVEDTRVGQRSDYDKLIMEIWTTGVISANDAIRKAASVVREFLLPLVSFEDSIVPSFGNPELQDSDLLGMSIEKLDLSVRSLNCLTKENVKTLGELISKTSDELSKARNFGKKSLEEIIEKLGVYGLFLGMAKTEALKVLSKNDKISR
ncbi:DNA-directed RNA polymerase subunit alpha [Borrelia sp. BU AG58]|uniref:DNA-directed RNA polymerase subunit alpha n=1 Tax=Borrelia sp. BU AG58 TaxID=2887345 RepID=UPI001E495994|nr:DNA-directed RNA polymerase subunit alpha [Borrelia sp. BU AG58]UER67670.1 DNA-directed RNA polymerase subunit alpha [Borrelia sp. BU AG58]